MFFGIISYILGVIKVILLLKAGWIKTLGFIFLQPLALNQQIFHESLILINRGIDMDIKKSLKDLAVFSSLTDNEMDAVVDICNVQQYKANEIIFEEGAKGDKLFIVAKGSIKLYLKVAGNIDEILVTLKQGGIFGELAVISEDYRNSSASAIEDTKLIFIDREHFKKLLNKKTSIGKKMLNVFVERLSERLKNTTSLYKQAVDWGLSISGILELNYNQIINHHLKVTIDFNSGKTASGILLKADKTNAGIELLLKTDEGKLMMIPYGAISALSFDQINISTEQE